jgi:pimeloyl-ACP methyl ester carboxylesterase
VRALYLHEFDAFLRYHDLGGDGPVRENRSILVDLLGFGFSDRPETFAYTLEDHARSIAGLLDALGLRDCDVIGHSLGGSVAIVLAALRPDLVSSLIAVEANLDAGMGPFTAAVLRCGEEVYVCEVFWSDLEQARCLAREHPDSAMAAIVEMIALSSPLASYRTSRSLTADRHPSLREQLVQLDMPRAFLVGERTLEASDKPASGEAGDGLEGTGVRRFIVANAGHVMTHDNPAGFAETIATALAGPS